MIRNKLQKKEGNLMSFFSVRGSVMITGNFEIVFIITYGSCCTEAHWVQFSRKKIFLFRSLQH